MRAKNTIKIVPGRKGPHLNVVAPNNKITLTTESYSSNTAARRAAEKLHRQLENSAIKDQTR